MESPPPADYRQYTFPGRHEGEQVLLLLRRHWFVLFTSMVLFVFLIVLPPLLGVVTPEGFIGSLRGTVWEGVVLLFLSGYYLFLWLFFFTVLVDYYLDVWVVTDERIVNIEQTGLFHRVISEQRIVRVQDVTSDVRGIFPTFLNFGNVFIQTAGERERFVFLQVPNPDHVKKLVLKAHEEAVKHLAPETQFALAQYGSEPEPRDFHPHHS